MIYRDAKKSDLPQIKAFIERTGYFGGIDPETLGGAWLVAEHDGVIHATVWCFLQPPHAFIDYWAGKGKTAAKLGLIAESQLRAAGVRYVRGTIARTNESALRMATEGFGMLSGPNYQLVFKELAHGNADNDATDDDTTGGADGGEPDATPPTASPADSGPTR